MGVSVGGKMMRPEAEAAVARKRLASLRWKSGVR